MMTTLKTPIGFLGFGEAGFHLARGLRGAGAPSLIAYDINMYSGAMGERIRSRAAETGTRLVDSPQTLAVGADVILSVVTAASAREAADSVAPYLTAGQLFADLNSVSPATKACIATVVAQGAGHFVEAAVLAAIPGPEHRVPILLNGPAAPAFIKRLSPYHMRLEAIDSPIGAAAAVKMCRSIVIKGLEALLLECALAAREYGAADRVYDSLAETYPGMDWRTVAEYMFGRVLEHGERRAHEMEEVATTLRDAGVEPLMTEATARRQAWEATLRRSGRLNGPRPVTTEALMALLVSGRATRDVKIG